MRLVACLLVCGCNQLLGLHATNELDAHVLYFDAPADAPFACPPIGTTPQFSALVRRVIDQDCVEYTMSPSAALGTAYCNNSSGGGSIGQGSADQLLTTIPNLVASGSTTYLHPRLVPEGDQLFTAQNDATQLIIAIFERTGTAWTPVATIKQLGTTPFSGSMRFGTPTRGPARRMLVTDRAFGPLIYELAFDGTTWNIDVQHDPMMDLGVASLLDPPSLSPDGLRIVFDVLLSSGTRTMYSDRPTIHDKFRTAERLVGVPDVFDGFLTEDCARVYFSGSGLVSYVEQQ